MSNSNARNSTVRDRLPSPTRDGTQPDPNDHDKQPIRDPTTNLANLNRAANQAAWLDSHIAANAERDANWLAAEPPRGKPTLAPGQIPSHRWVSFVGGETLLLKINLKEADYPDQEDIIKFHAIVKLYSVYTKTCLIFVTLPQYGDDVMKSNHNPTFFNLVSVLNRFRRITRLEVTLRMPRENFTQLSNAAQFYRLKFTQWKLFVRVGKAKLEQIHIGSKTDRRLNGWYNANLSKFDTPTSQSSTSDEPQKEKSSLGWTVVR
ncbi:hypothetical protein NHQ30_002777 [Ciborinia camelliae]|nr:hypothetical protein NHQ30_002777 [Ciborinia camelliae]